jgi:uncharacterized membrane protein
MKALIKPAVIFYGICMAGIAILQFIYMDFRPVIFPALPGIPAHFFWAYLTGAAVLVAALGIIFEKNPRKTALILGGVLLFFCVFVHIPYMIFVNPYTKHLGVWTDALKLLALSGGAFIVAGSFPTTSVSAKQSPLIGSLEKILPLGRVFFGIMLVCFGIDHFLYTVNISKLVPGWIPWPIFWTYFAAVTLIGSGVAFILKIKLQLVGRLCALMIFLWLIVLHIPLTFIDPYSAEGNNFTSDFEALGFSGVAFLISLQEHSKESSAKN